MRMEDEKPIFLRRSIAAINKGYLDKRLVYCIGFFETRDKDKEDDMIEIRDFDASRATAMSVIKQKLQTGEYKSFVFVNSCTISPKDNLNFKFVGITFYYINEYGEDQATLLLYNKDGKCIGETEADWIKTIFDKEKLWK